MEPMQGTSATTWPAYFDKYENLAFSRDDDGVLVLRFHTDGGPVVFTGQTHQDFPAALEQLSLDRANKALVITGTGASFMDEIDGPSLGEIFKPEAWEKIRTEGAKVLQRLLELPMPVSGVANGPATVHSEYLLLSDIHIASERATYGDSPHPAFGITGGDGLHVVWEEIVGSARAKWLLWTGDQIDAKTALEWGVVSEVVPHERAVDRGMTGT
jgi:enoyl-CoA hydratase/carnithine racemase